MLRFVVGAEDLLRTRFALSPIFELHHLIRALASPHHQGVPEAWLARLRPRFAPLRADPALDAVLALHMPRSGATFFSPPPRGSRRRSRTTSPPCAPHHRPRSGPRSTSTCAAATSATRRVRC